MKYIFIASWNSCFNLSHIYIMKKKRREKYEQHY